MSSVLAQSAINIGNILLERMDEWTTQAKLADLSGETEYAVRWYIYQLRQDGYIVEAGRTDYPLLYRRGHRGYQLTDIR